MDYALRGTQQNIARFRCQIDFIELGSERACVCKCQQRAAFHCCRMHSIGGVIAPLSSETWCHQVIHQLFSFIFFDGIGRYIRPPSDRVQKFNASIWMSVDWKAIDSNYLVEMKFAVCEHLPFSIYCQRAVDIDCYTMPGNNAAATPLPQLSHTRTTSDHSHSATHRLHGRWTSEFVSTKQFKHCTEPMKVYK